MGEMNVLENKGKKVQSVEKAMALLDCFWAGRKEYSLAELAAQTGWAKSTIHALLCSMLTNGTIEQDVLSGKYRLGFHTFELGCVAQERWSVRPLAAQAMRKITERTGEALYLGMRCMDEILLVENSENYDNFKISSPLGARMPMYGCSQGKMLLAQMTDAELEAYLKRTTFRTYTPYTIRDAAQLKKELQMVRVQGFAVEYSELRTGIKSVAAPIFEENRVCDYAISAVTIAKGSATGDNFQKLQEIVVQAAAEITKELQAPSGWWGR